MDGDYEREEDVRHHVGKKHYGGALWLEQYERWRDHMKREQERMQNEIERGKKKIAELRDDNQRMHRRLMSRHIGSCRVGMGGYDVLGADIGAGLIAFKPRPGSPTPYMGGAHNRIREEIGSLPKGYVGMGRRFSL